MSSRWTIILVTMTLLASSCMAAPSNPQTAEVGWHPQQEEFGNTGTVAGASAELARYEEGISFQIRAEGLTPGNAYTLWLVVINNPEACSSDPCSGSDILEVAETDSQVLYAGGTVAGGNRGTLAGSTPVGPLEGWLPDRSLQDTSSAEVQLVINDHGPALPEMMPEMIDTYRAGCSDESPFPPIFPETALADGEPGPNTCLLFQVAVFPAP
ncbi:MAG TPA: hypothetical protein VFT54_05420 [Acidimicrobiia bacterium]|nr:hypothetical protein [Acidimicrobiia bacterium]